MNRIARKRFFHFGAICFLFSGAVQAAHVQSQSNAKINSIIQGTVQDLANHPIPGAIVSLASVDPPQSFNDTTDASGHFRFSSLFAGTYTLLVKAAGFADNTEGPFALGRGGVKSLTVKLSKGAEPQFEFSDEPQFTVAGVTDTSALGGHGSDRVVRNSDALSKDTVSLAHGELRDSGLSPDEAEAEVCAELAGKETAAGRFQLAELEERRGDSLAAAKDYQRAAELQPSEQYLFSWGAELLLHHAPEPAAEVFSKGMRLYPQSVRMRLGFGAAKYAEGLREEAGRVILEASDVNPSDPAPYLFLGRMQATEATVPAAWTERMKRFVELHPEDATAHCLYASALAKQGGEARNFDEIAFELQRSIALDPKLGSAYLQLGILRSERKDYSGAIAALRKAVETTPLPDEAHYRLAEVYRRTGDTDKANQETELFRQASAEKKKQAERERHELQQFVYTLRGQPPSPASAPNPR